MGYKVIEIPQTRVYPKNGKIPTKINFFGNIQIMVQLIKVVTGYYRPDQTRPDQTRPDQTRPDQTRINIYNDCICFYNNPKYKKLQAILQYKIAV